MANTVVELKAASGLSLTLKLFAYGSDTLANTGGDTLTEATNCKGRYTATVTEALDGLYDAIAVDGSGNLCAEYSVLMADDTDTHRCFDPVNSEGATVEDTDAIASAVRAAFAGDLPVLIGGYANGVLAIVRGDSYGTATRTLVVPEPSGANWPALDGTWTVKFNARLRDTTGATGTTTIADVTCVIVDADTVRIDLLATDTAGLDLGPPLGTGKSGAGAWDWELEASKSSDRFTLISGSMTVLKDLKTT